MSESLWHEPRGKLIYIGLKENSFLCFCIEHGNKLWFILFILIYRISYLCNRVLNYAHMKNNGQFGGSTCLISEY